MNVFIYLFLSYIIKYSITQYNDYCDLTKSCDSCIFCGTDTKDYCSCNFYNSYCIISSTSKQYFSSDFLLNYDGCLNNDENYKICGSSKVSISDGKTTTIYFDSTTNTNFVCYYSISGIKNHNQIDISINNQDNKEQHFDIYIITYHVDSSHALTMLSDSIVTTNFQMRKYNISKISIYFDVEDGQNLDKISLSFLYKDISDGTITVKRSQSSSGNNTGLIVGIIFGIIAFIIIIIVGILLYKRCKRKKRNNNISNTQNTSINNTTLTPQYISVINNNKEKMNLLLKNELSPKIYNITNNDCSNCTICMEKFIINSSVIITTKCNHSFHEICFKNWVFKNIINPKCPNCNEPILGPQDINLPNITLPSNYDYTIQTLGNGTKSNYNSMV